MAEGPADNLQEFPQQIQRMLDHYRLVDNPFGKAINAKVFSRVGNRGHIASQIERLFASTVAECLLIAPSGGGKRTLARQIVKQLGAGWRVAWVDGWEVLDSVDLLRELVGQLKLGHKIEGSSEEEAPRIAELIARKAEEGEHSLLVVQHADQLMAETQQWLRSLGTQGGRPELRLRQLWLAESALPIEPADDEHQWTTTNLEPMTDAEALEYLGDRFSAAGRFEGLPIEADEVARLNRIAGGWPGRLNRVTRDYLVGRTRKPLEWQPPAELLYALIAIAVIAAASVVAYRYLFTQPDTEIAETPTPEESEPNVEPAGTDPAINEPDDADREATAQSAAVESESEGDGTADTPEEESSDRATATDAVAETGTGAGMETATATATETETETETETATESDTGTGRGTGTGTDTEADTGTDTVAGAETDTEADQDADRDTDTATLDSEVTPAGDDVAAGEDAGDRTVYTIQLAGARDRENLAALGRDIDVRVDTDIARTTREGQPWYVLIAGRHDSASQARDAIAALPPELRSRSPWPRPMSGLEVLGSGAQTIRVPAEQPDGGVAGGEPDAGEVAAGEATFTLQLVGVRDRSSLEELVSGLDEPERYEIVSTTFEGRPWYVLTHGRYESAQAARSDIERLPEELEQYSPWPRRLSDFQ